MASYGWTPEQVTELKRLVLQGGLFYTEIAERLGKNAQAVRAKARLMKLPKTLNAGRMGEWNSKHSHLQKEVMTYFLTHSLEETRKHFHLTKSEIKSLFTAGYRMADLKHLRKETRPHTPWRIEHMVFLLQHAGLRRRKWLVEQIPRGSSVHLVKDRLSVIGISSRNMQGLTLSQFIEAFGKRPDFFLQTDCGPDGAKGTLPTRWKIVPWVWLADEIKGKRLKTAPELRILIETRAMFQEWIFGGDALRKMKRICRKAEKEREV